MPPTSIHIANPDLVISDPINSDIDGRRCVFDEDQLFIWYFYFSDGVMEKIYYFDIKPVLNNKDNASLEWEVINLNLNPSFVCPSSIEYTKCFIRKGIVYLFVPEDSGTKIWSLDIK